MPEITRGIRKALGNVEVTTDNVRDGLRYRAENSDVDVRVLSCQGGIKVSVRFLDGKWHHEPIVKAPNIAKYVEYIIDKMVDEHLSNVRS